VPILAAIYAAMAEDNPMVCGLRELLDASRPLPDATGLAGWIGDRHFSALDVERGDNDAARTALERIRSAGEQLVTITYLHKEQPTRLLVPAATLLGQIAINSERLADEYRWNSWDATRWLICGGTPPVPWVVRWRSEIRYSFTANFDATDTTTRLTLEIDPTLTPAEVAVAYSHARSAIFPRDRLRSLDRKALALAAFYLKQQENPPTWEAWRKRWNAGPGRKHGIYRGDGGGPWNFPRDVRSAYERLVKVGWQPETG
jgi:hypothetical protein